MKGGRGCRGGGSVVGGVGEWCGVSDEGGSYGARYGNGGRGKVRGCLGQEVKGGRKGWVGEIGEGGGGWWLLIRGERSTGFGKTTPFEG